jgi:hypothetical protein
MVEGDTMYARWAALLVLPILAQASGSTTLPHGNKVELGGASSLFHPMELILSSSDPGGSLRLKLSGPLAADLGKGGGSIHWSGEIQARFDVISERIATD